VGWSLPVFDLQEQSENEYPVTSGWTNSVCAERRKAADLGWTCDVDLEK